MIAQSEVAEHLFQVIDFRCEVSFLVAEKLDNQYCGRGAFYEFTKWFKLRFSTCRVEDKPVDQFDRGRAVFEDCWSGTECLQQSMELDGAKCPCLGTWYQVQANLYYQG